MKLLIIEDEKSLVELIKRRLEHANYLIDSVYDGKTGLEYALKDIYDLIILDIMLPYVDGIEILKQIKENGIHAKIIMLTAKGAIDDKISAFNLGADDYLTKPFHLEELLARVNVHLQRNNDNDTKMLKFDDLILDLKTSVISSASTGEKIEVSHKEYLLLEYFINNPGQVITKSQIYDKVWGLDNTLESNSLEAYLSFVRRKFRTIGTNVNIRAIRGLGYKLESADGQVKD